MRERRSDDRSQQRSNGPRLPPGVSFSADGSRRDEVPSSRPAQVASVLQRALQERIVRGLSDPRLQGMVSIQEVLMSPDLLSARVKVSVLPADRGPLSVAALRNAVGFLRSSLRESTSLRRVPELKFELITPPEIIPPFSSTTIVEDPS
ncbi:MAG: 30S ribosome-binding factor RbfA [Phycisphaerales bacterium]|nr:30S ribosome-binding factor RbfA [Phycisphaerales bacterium]